jgi:hypothetical protein
MAERVKRRVAAARLAVAFVAAGTIAGATAWAQADPPPTAQSSASDIFAKIGDIKGEQIQDHSLKYVDFAKGQIPSIKMFDKLDQTFVKFKKATNSFKYDVNGDINAIKGELPAYVKMSDADARYIKLSDQVVRGNGSVHTATGQQSGNESVSLLDLPGIIAVDGLPGSQIKITNNSDQTLTHTACNKPGGGVEPPGALDPGKSLLCDGSATQLLPAVQLTGAGTNPTVMTLNFSSIQLAPGNPTTQDTVQILIGL